MPQGERRDSRGRDQPYFTLYTLCTFLKYLFLCESPVLVHEYKIRWPMQQRASASQFSPRVARSNFIIPWLPFSRVAVRSYFVAGF